MSSQARTLFWGLGYVCFTVLEVGTVKGLNNWADVYLATYSAMALNQVWIFLLPSFIWTRWRRRRAARGSAISPGAFQGKERGTRALARHDSEGGENVILVSVPVTATVTTQRQDERVYAASCVGSTDSAGPAGAAVTLRAVEAAPGAQPDTVAPLPQPSRTRVAVGYTLFSLLTYGITLLRNVSANAIPGSTFSLFISTSSKLGVPDE